LRRSALYASRSGGRSKFGFWSLVSMADNALRARQFLVFWGTI
jgi:hypothetical protein